MHPPRVRFTIQWLMISVAGVAGFTAGAMKFGPVEFSIITAVILSVVIAIGLVLNPPRMSLRRWMTVVAVAAVLIIAVTDARLLIKDARKRVEDDHWLRFEANYSPCETEQEERDRERARAAEVRERWGWLMDW